jgi:hypothetical protein
MQESYLSRQPSIRHHAYDDVVLTGNSHSSSNYLQSQYNQVFDTAHVSAQPRGDDVVVRDGQKVKPIAEKMSSARDFTGSSQRASTYAPAEISLNSICSGGTFISPLTREIMEFVSSNDDTIRTQRM